MRELYAHVFVFKMADPLLLPAAEQRVAMRDHAWDDCNHRLSVPIPVLLFFLVVIKKKKKKNITCCSGNTF